MALEPDDIERRVRAKHLNERLKLAATSINTVGLTVLGAAVLVPLVGGAVSASAVIWILVAVALHSLAQLFLGRLRSED